MDLFARVGLRFTSGITGRFNSVAPQKENLILNLWCHHVPDIQFSPFSAPDLDALQSGFVVAGHLAIAIKDQVASRCPKCFYDKSGRALYFWEIRASLGTMSIPEPSVTNDRMVRP